MISQVFLAPHFCRYVGVIWNFEKADFLLENGLKSCKIWSAEAHHFDKVRELANKFETVFVSCVMIGNELIRKYIYKRKENIFN